MKKHTFTLVELLVVIMIIGVLAGLILPAIQKGRVKAEVVDCKQRMNALATAIKQYESTYGYMPLAIGKATSSSSDVYGAETLIDYLTGTNPRGIRFLEPTASGGAYQDPWEGDFYFAWDLETGNAYDGQIPEANVTGVNNGGNPINASFIIWSQGIDGSVGAADDEDNVYSIKTVWSTTNNYHEVAR